MSNNITECTNFEEMGLLDRARVLFVNRTESVHNDKDGDSLVSLLGPEFTDRLDQLLNSREVLEKFTSDHNTLSPMIIWETSATDERSDFENLNYEVTLTGKNSDEFNDFEKGDEDW